MANSASIVPVLLGAVALLGLHALPANAAPQISRTFVSNSGSDGNTCAAINPCLTLNGAFVKTSAGGEINILNGGDFGTLIISKAITIRGEGNILGVTAASGNVIVVNAGATDVVNLIGLDILGGFSTDGITVQSAAIVNIADCQFHDLNLGIYENSAVPIFVTVKNSLFQNDLTGIYVMSSSGTAKVMIDNVAVFGNSTDGGGAGIFATGAGASVVVNNSTIANNGTGLAAFGGAALFTYGNNRVNFNGDNGGPNQTVLTLK